MDERVAVRLARGRLEEPGAVAGSHVEQAGDPRLPTSRISRARGPKPAGNAGQARFSTGVERSGDGDRGAHVSFHERKPAAVDQRLQISADP